MSIDVDQLVDSYFLDWVEAVLDRREGKIGCHENLSLVQANLCTALRAAFKERAANSTEAA
jgi:hypothetical protein